MFAESDLFHGPSSREELQFRFRELEARWNIENSVREEMEFGRLFDTPRGYVRRHEFAEGRELVPARSFVGSQAGEQCLKLSFLKLEPVDVQGDAEENDQCCCRESR